MKFLEERIRRDGVVKPGSVLKVDAFLNHQMDVALLDALGAEWARRFAGAIFLFHKYLLCMPILPRSAGEGRARRAHFVRPRDSPASRSFPVHTDFRYRASFRREACLARGPPSCSAARPGVRAREGLFCLCHRAGKHLGVDV